MVIVVGGSNLYGCDMRLKTLISGAEFTGIILSEEGGISRLEESVQGASLFSTQDTVVARDFGELNKADQEKVISVAANTPDSTSLVIYAPKTNKNSLKPLTKVANETYMEDELKPFELAEWVINETKLQGGDISKADARKLVDFVGNDQMLLSNEIKKLTSNTKQITTDLIEELATKTPQTTIFQMLDAMTSGNTKRALDSYEELLAQKLDPHYIMSMICWQANIMTIAYGAKGKNLDSVAKETGVSAFVLKKTAPIVRRLNKSAVMMLNDSILSIDSKLKSAPIDAERSVEQLIVRLSTSLQRAS